jgi:hypothetical protein
MPKLAVLAPYSLDFKDNFIYYVWASIMGKKLQFYFILFCWCLMSGNAL